MPLPLLPSLFEDEDDEEEDARASPLERRRSSFAERNALGEEGGRE